MNSQRLVIHWVPSHLDADNLEDPFEDWAQQNNDWVDALAGFTNENRPPSLLKLQTDAKQHHVAGAARMRQLEQFYFCVAAQPKTCDAGFDSTIHVTEHDADNQIPLLILILGTMRMLFQFCQHMPKFRHNLLLLCCNGF